MRWRFRGFELWEKENKMSEGRMRCGKEINGNEGKESRDRIPERLKFGGLLIL